MKPIKIENYTNVPIEVSVTEFDDEFRVIIEDAKRECEEDVLGIEGKYPFENPKDSIADNQALK